MAISLACGIILNIRCDWRWLTQTRLFICVSIPVFMVTAVTAVIITRTIIICQWDILLLIRVLIVIMVILIVIFIIIVILILRITVTVLPRYIRSIIRVVTKVIQVILYFICMSVSKGECFCHSLGQPDLTNPDDHFSGHWEVCPSCSHDSCPSDQVHEPVASLHVPHGPQTNGTNCSIGHLICVFLVHLHILSKLKTSMFFIA